MIQSAEDRVSLVQAKVDRARRHVAEFTSVVSDFFGSNPYEVSTKRDSQTRRLIHYLSRVAPTPISLALIAGDAIQNLRSALDHLAQQLYLVGTGRSVGTDRDVAFPVGRNASHFPG